MRRDGMRTLTTETKAKIIEYIRNDEYTPAFKRLLRGFRGEKDFDRFVEKAMQPEWFYLTNFSFSNNTLTQVDSILITPQTVNVYEVKNYLAECEMSDGTFYYNRNVGPFSPFVQLDNIKLRFNHLLATLNYRGPVNYYVVMINESCQFKEADKYKNLLMRNMIYSHLKNLEASRNPKFKPAQLAKKILESSCVNSHQENFQIDFEKLQPGIICTHCGSMSTHPKYRVIKCEECGCEMKKMTCLTNLIDELSILNQQNPITTKQIYAYCDGKLSYNYISKHRKKVMKLRNTSSGKFNKNAANELLQNYLELVERKVNCDLKNDDY